MINTHLESIVDMVMAAYKNTHQPSIEYLKFFELEVRKQLMQKYCNGGPVPKQHTYTITAGEGVMGKWTTRECPPNMDTKQILNG